MLIIFTYIKKRGIFKGKNAIFVYIKSAVYLFIFSFQVTYAYRMNAETRNYVNDVLKKFIGSKYYHNYTSGK